MNRFVKSFMFTLVIVMYSAYSRDLTIVVPDSWEGFTRDTSKIVIAAPLLGCFELESNNKLPISNWKGLFVQEMHGRKLNSSNSDRNTVLNDIKLKIIHHFSFSDLSVYEITYEGNNLNAINDTFQERPIAFIANLPKDHNVFSIYDGRKKEDKRIELNYNSINYKISIDKKDSCSEICKIFANDKEQVLFKNNGCLVGTKIIWVGDLNGDKKIDIILHRLGKEGLYDRIDLWLSSNENGKIVSLASSIYYGGCH